MRNLGLDILRFIAVLLVVVRHGEFTQILSPLTEVIQKGGWVGVDLFFVISGFLISSLLFREFSQTQNISIKRFLIRRGFKIYPPFWVVIGLSFLGFKIVKQTCSASQIAAELLFVQNYWPGIWLYTWSLAVEEHFYLGISFLFWIFKKLGLSQMIKLLPIICFVVCVLCFGLRYREISGNGPYFYFLYAFKSHLRIDSLCFGVFISYLVYFKNFGKNCQKKQLKIFL